MRPPSPDVPWPSDDAGADRGVHEDDAAARLRPDARARRRRVGSARRSTTTAASSGSCPRPTCSPVIAPEGVPGPGAAPAEEDRRREARTAGAACSRPPRCTAPDAARDRPRPARCSTTTWPAGGHRRRRGDRDRHPRTTSSGRSSAPTTISPTAVAVLLARPRRHRPQGRRPRRRGQPRRRGRTAHRGCRAPPLVARRSRASNERRRHTRLGWRDRRPRDLDTVAARLTSSARHRARGLRPRAPRGRPAAMPLNFGTSCNSATSSGVSGGRWSLSAW